MRLKLDIANLDGATLNTAGSYGATTGDGEYVFDRHQEWEISVTGRSRNVLIYCIHQLHDVSLLLLVAIQSAQSGTSNYRNVIAREIVGAQELTNFHLYQLKQLIIMIVSMFPVEISANLEDTLFSIFYFALNVPVFIVAWIGIGKRFTAFTFINVALVSLFSNLLGLWDQGWIYEISRFVNSSEPLPWMP